MKLKKINEDLQKGLILHGLTEANELQRDSFSTIKSGVDCIIQSERKSGKTTTIVINVLQKLKSEGEESPRALIYVQDKEQVLEMVRLFDQLGKFNNLSAYGVHEKSDLDDDKNQISMGVDVLIGTPNKLNMLFSTAGFNVNRLLMVIVDDADILLKNRYDSVILRMSESIGKAQRIFFCNEITDKVEFLSEKIMIEPLFLEIEKDEEIED
ncbi:DEAD/DEAH box helicase [Flavobacterium sp. N2270]|uniref:DEAD/DEAH box helicase n=1 Tax=Flavobacterium sp. N2270 TaxID=2986831 RepID=UPI0022253156|nr:DEAD/DEAH box helicase [Flavobacterium sp. N2270]